MPHKYELLVTGRQKGIGQKNLLDRKILKAEVCSISQVAGSKVCLINGCTE
jgi:hypothetical protein